MTVARMKGLGTLPVVLCLLVARPGLAQVPDRPGGVAPLPVDPTGALPLPAGRPPISVDPSISPEIVRDDPRQVLSRKQRLQVQGLPPEQLQVTAVGPRSVILSWQPPVAQPGLANPANAMGYRVYMARQGQETYSGGGIVTETTATTDATLLPASTYSFKVSAVYPPESNASEGMSAAVSATLPPAGGPTGLKAVLGGQGRVSLSWDALPGSNGYRLFRNDTLLVDLKRQTSSPISPFDRSPFDQPPPMPTSFADSIGVGTYRYQIRAVYRESHADNAAATESAATPTPPVSVTIEASTRVKYCQWGNSP